MADKNTSGSNQKTPKAPETPKWVRDRRDRRESREMDNRRAYDESLRRRGL